MRRWVALVVAAASLTASGCIFHRLEVNDISVAERARGIQPGVTLESELPALLGTQPTSFITTPDGGKLLVYSYGLAKTGGFNLIVLSVQRTNQGLDTMFIQIAPDGVVRRTWIGDHSEEVEWGWWAFGD